MIDIKVGDNCVLKRGVDFVNGQGEVEYGEIGYITNINLDDDIIVVNFPNCHEWHGRKDEVSVVSLGNSILTNLEETIGLMTSSDYKDRFKAEYWQTKIRYEKLHKMLIKNVAGTLGFEPTCPISLLEDQARHMESYLRCLEIRAEMEDVEL